ncbi:MAG TPA: hypothetical protein VGR16_10205 [Thermomicrobiales bacterium]|nr:hypothetical protein [Thermomicrobiales bacterium]
MRDVEAERSCMVTHGRKRRAPERTVGDVERATKSNAQYRFRSLVSRRASPTRQNLLLLLALIATALVYIWPRTLGIDRVVTVDEPVFLGISANFYNAVAHGDFAKTSQFLYPAVPIMWAGMVGYLAEIPNYVTDYPDQIEALKSVHGPIRAAGGEPLSVLVAGRMAKIVLQAGIFLIAIWLTYRLFGLAITTLAAAFIVFDPFLIAHDQLLHVDGLTGITAFGSMLAATYADRKQTRKELWALAGVLAALSWLTRLTGLVLIPIILLVIADGAISRCRQGTQTGRVALLTATKTATVVVGASLITTIVVWPALWVDARGTIEYTIEQWRQSIETPHPWGLYFAGETVAGDPGILFYVFVFLYKITPFTLFGLALIAFASLFRIDSIIPRHSWRPIVILASFVLVYSVGMAAGTRKFDRYILPDFLFFDLLAAIGIVGVARLLWARRNIGWRIASGMAIVGLATGQLFTALAQRPYMLDYYNPLLGGTRTAQEMLMVGWGEGLDQAADFILSQPGGETSVVRTSISRSTMLYFFPETVTVRGLGDIGTNRASAMTWADTDYAVTHILQWKRGIHGPVGPYLEDFQPLYTVTIDGVEFVRVYDLRRIPPPDWMVQQSGCSRQFGDGITFVGYGQHRRGDGETLGPNAHMVELVFQTNAATRVLPEYQVTGTLHPKANEGQAISFTTSFTPSREAGLLAKTVQTVQLPEGRKLSDYWLQVSVIDPATRQPFPAVNLATSGRSSYAGLPAC